MKVMNLQFFGGRGSAGGNSTRNTGSEVSVTRQGYKTILSNGKETIEIRPVSGYAPGTFYNIYIKEEGKSKFRKFSESTRNAPMSGIIESMTHRLKIRNYGNMNT